MEENEEKPKRVPKRKMIKKHAKKPSRFETGLSQHQIDTNEEFMKYREGETEAQWLKRTRFRRPQTAEDIEKNTYLIRKNKTLGAKLKTQKRKIRIHNVTGVNVVQTIERKYSDLKFFGIVKRYYSVKHGIPLDDLALAFYFYENYPFTKSEFNNVVKMHFGRMFGEFKRFQENGYVINVVRTKKFLKKADELMVTDKYMLSIQMVHIITAVYKTLNEFREIQDTDKENIIIPRRIQTMINKYNRGIREILTGKKSTESIVKVELNNK